MIQQSKGNRANPYLAVKEISDVYIRENFNALARYFLEQNQLLNFQFIEFSFDEPVTEERVPHGLGFTPKDIVRAKVTGSGICRFNHHLFDDQYLNITTTGPVRVRCFVGTYFRDASQFNPSETDTEDFYAGYPNIPGKNSNIVSVIRAYEIQASDDIILVGTPNDSDITPITLPDATLNKGRVVTVIKIDNNALFHTISPKSIQTIDGSNSGLNLLFLQERIQLFSDGSGWRTLSRNFPEHLRPMISGQTNNGGTISATTKLPFNEFWTNAGGAGAIDYDSTNRRFYIRVPGRYRVTLNGFKLNGPGSCRIYLGLNTDTPGGTTHRGHIYTNFSGYVPQPLNSIIDINAGQYIVFYLTEGALYDNSGDRFNQFNIQWEAPLSG